MQKSALVEFLNWYYKRSALDHLPQEQPVTRLPASSPASAAPGPVPASVAQVDPLARGTDASRPARRRRRPRANPRRPHPVPRRHPRGAETPPPITLATTLPTPVPPQPTSAKKGFIDRPVGRALAIGLSLTMVGLILYTLVNVGIVYVSSHRTALNEGLGWQHLGLLIVPVLIYWWFRAALGK